MWPHARVVAEPIQHPRYWTHPPNLSLLPRIFACNTLLYTPPHVYSSSFTYILFNFSLESFTVIPTLHRVLTEVWSPTMADQTTVFNCELMCHILTKLQILEGIKARTTSALFTSLYFHSKWIPNTREVLSR
jgi:hypothetical protein